jgi:hypothetical protein
MESRSAWTDERLDDRFDHIDGELRELRTDVRELRVELRSEIGGLRGEIDALRLAMIRVGGAGFIGLIAAVLVRGG